VNIVAVAGIGVNVAAVASGGEGVFGVAGFVVDSPVACPGAGNRDTGFEEHTQYYVEWIVVDVGGTFDHIGVRDPEVHHQEANNTVLEREGRPDSGCQRTVGPVGQGWVGCCTLPVATLRGIMSTNQATT